MDISDVELEATFSPFVSVFSFSVFIVSFSNFFAESVSGLIVDLGGSAPEFSALHLLYRWKVQSDLSAFSESVAEDAAEARFVDLLTVEAKLISDGCLSPIAEIRVPEVNLVCVGEDGNVHARDIVEVHL